MGVETCLVGLGELDLVVLGQQRVAADLVQVQAEGVRRLEIEQVLVLLRRHLTPRSAQRWHSSVIVVS
jgi:hypothetical protein